MKMKIRFVAMLGALGLVSALAHQSHGANAIWAEEANGAPSANWQRVLDDADGILATAIDATSTPGIWRIPAGTNSTGMAWTNADGDTACCQGDQPVQSPTHGLSEWTFEVRYQINGPLIPQNDPTFESYPFAVSVGAFTHVPFDVHDGLSPADSFYQIKTSEAGESIITEVDGVPPTSRGVFHTMRMTQNATEQKLYFDNTLLKTVDITGLGPPFGGIFTRSLYVRQFSQGGGFDPFREVLIDYMRVGSGVVPIGEALNGVPEPTTGLLGLALCGLGAFARRRS